MPLKTGDGKLCFPDCGRPRQPPARCRILIVMKTLEQWDEFVSDRYDPNRKTEDFRKFDDSAPGAYASSTG